MLQNFGMLWIKCTWYTYIVLLCIFLIQQVPCFSSFIGQFDLPLHVRSLWCGELLCELPRSLDGAAQITQQGVKHLRTRGIFLDGRRQLILIGVLSDGIGRGHNTGDLQGTGSRPVNDGVLYHEVWAIWRVLPLYQVVSAWLGKTEWDPGRTCLLQRWGCCWQNKDHYNSNLDQRILEWQGDATLYTVDLRCCLQYPHKKTTGTSQWVDVLLMMFKSSE